MKPEIKKLWIAALRSGKYKQTTGTLRSIDEYKNKRYCCLGVLCDIYSKRRRKKVAWNQIVLPLEVAEWAGLQDTNPDVRTCKGGEGHALSYLNDGMGYNFKEIAKCIKDSL